MTGKIGPEGLEEAAYRLVSVYQGDKLGELLGDAPEISDERWRHSIAQFPDFADSFLSFRAAMRKVAETRRVYRQSLSILAADFERVEHTVTRSLLGDILVARLSPDAGYFDYKADPDVETSAMAVALGLEGWMSQDAISLQPTPVASAVLTNRLRLDYRDSQTPSTE